VPAGDQLVETSVKLNHLDLQVPDVQRLAAFLEQHFDFERRSNDTSPALAILADRGGFLLVIQRRRPDEAYPENFHIGFLVDDVDAVHAQHARLTAAGVDAVGAVSRNARGTMFYLRAPGDVLIEVSARTPTPGG
jgi:catechol 2,3-dioxygenase-like lactoylglutathione lyase family enzyme